MPLKDDIEIIENLDKLFMKKHVDIKALTDINPEEIDNSIDHILKGGTRASVPLSTAIKLIEKGLATIPEEYINWIKKVIWREKSMSKVDALVKHEDDFYQKLIITLYAIKYDKKGVNLEEDLRIHITHLTRQILMKRLSILLSKATSSTGSITQNMAPEEDLLFRIVKTVTSMWLEKLNINTF
ncbi:MAG TPA: hypothetical protein EYH44_00920 [Thermoprotei archaeon]|nr:hypothetical protein [Thermoprotei archaeon]